MRSNPWKKEKPHHLAKAETPCETRFLGYRFIIHQRGEATRMLGKDEAASANLASSPFGFRFFSV